MAMQKKVKIKTKLNPMKGTPPYTGYKPSPLNTEKITVPWAEAKPMTPAVVYKKSIINTPKKKITVKKIKPLK